MWLGTDSLKLSFWGATVIAYERFFFVNYILVKDALQRFNFFDNDTNVFNLKNGEFLKSNFNQRNFKDTVLYYDPMYVDKNKSLPNRNMQILRDLVGCDDDVDDTLMSLLKLKPKRLVVKRPIKGEIYFKSLLNHQIKGKSTRFDVYI